MIIEIRKAEFLNKGAELMLHSILEKLRAKYPNAKFVMTPFEQLAPYEKRIALGLYQKATFWKYSIRWDFLFNLLPKKVKRLYGLIDNKDIDVVIDASGFSYTDQWGTGSTLELANATKTWKKNKTTVILLPQAFGPFSSSELKKLLKIAINNSDLVFAREEVSYKYLTDVVGESKKILLYPDFTNLIKGSSPQDFDYNENKFCIIPNYRMLDKTTKKEQDSYIPFISKCINYLIKNNQKPFLLVHEGDKDFSIAIKINELLSEKINIIIEEDPLKIKGIIGGSTGLISSRFHGLVSGLSQSIPSLATGWSHKYEMLFNDYNFKDGLIDVKEDDLEIYRKIDLIIEENSRKEIINKISIESEKLKKRSKDMWERVYEEIDKRGNELNAN